MKAFVRLTLAVAFVVICSTAARGGDVDAVYREGKVRGDSWDWPTAMLEVAKKHKAKNAANDAPFVPMGDSITYQNQCARYAVAGQGKSAEEKAISKWMKCDGWGSWKKKCNGWWLAADDQPRGRSWTAASGCTAAQYVKGGKGGLPSIDKILAAHNPQVAWILLGTNDLSAGIPVDKYLASMETIYTKCIANGTIPICQTVPPMSKDRKKLLFKYNEGLIKLAAKLKIPMVDVYGEFLKRRPGDSWKKTLIRDWAHPTGKRAKGPANEENLKNDGSLLRTWLALQKMIEIKKKVIDKK